MHEPPVKYNKWTKEFLKEVFEDFQKQSIEPISFTCTATLILEMSDEMFKSMWPFPGITILSGPEGIKAIHKRAFMLSVSDRKYPKWMKPAGPTITVNDIRYKSEREKQWEDIERNKLFRKNRSIGPTES